MASLADVIERKLREAFNPTQLRVENQSHLHAGHTGSPGTGESHFHIVVESAAFLGQSRVARQRMVMAALKEELAGPVHALSMELSVPETTLK